MSIDKIFHIMKKDSKAIFKNPAVVITIIAIITIVIVAIGAYFIIKQIKSNDKVGKLNKYYEKLK